MRTNEDRDYISDNDDVAVMFMDYDSPSYIAHSNSEVDKKETDDCAYLNRLEKTYQSRVPVNDGAALFVLRRYAEDGRNGGILSGHQNSGVVQYHLPFEMKESFNWYCNWQVIRPVNLLRLNTSKACIDQVQEIRTPRT